MIQAEISQNPVLEESGEGGEELTPEELQPLLEAERVADPADQSILDVTSGPVEVDASDGAYTTEGVDSANLPAVEYVEAEAPTGPAVDAVANAPPPRRLPRRPRRPIPSTRSTSGRISTITWIPVTRARLPKTSKSPLLKPSFPRRSRFPITSIRSWPWSPSAKKSGTPPTAWSATWTKTAICSRAPKKWRPRAATRWRTSRKPFAWCRRSIRRAWPHPTCASACCCSSKAAAPRTAWPGRSCSIT